MRRSLLTLAVAVSLAGGVAQAAPDCASPGAAKDVEVVVRGWFGAFARDDYAAGYALQAPGFYAYDNGRRFDATSLGELLRALKTQGAKVEWNLHDMDIHVSCDQAWAAWVNTGASGKAGAMTPVAWLESAVLTYQDGRWRMAFLHSGRVAAPN